jgi:hypothetical protein
MAQHSGLNGELAQTQQSSGGTLSFCSPSIPNLRMGRVARIYQCHGRQRCTIGPHLPGTTSTIIMDARHRNVIHPQCVPDPGPTPHPGNH